MTVQTRGGDGRARRSAQSAERDMRAAELHGQGWSFPRIAAELGFASRGHAHNAVERAFASIPTPGGEEAKRLDLERLDRLIEHAWAVMIRPHLAHSNGRVIRRIAGVLLDEEGNERLDDAGKPILRYEDVLDDGPGLAALAQIRGLLERRAKIFGYDAPSRSRVEVITAESVEEAITRLEADLAGNDPVRPGAA